jgi:cytochrome P450
LSWSLDRRDLLALVVNRPDENGDPISDARIAGHVPTLFGATYETCQNALVWTLILLDQHPKVARDLFDELRSQSGSVPPSFDQIMQLPLLDAVVKESMRILPPAPQQFRVAERDTTLNGFPVAARTRVMLSSFLTNRESDFYPEADRFKPERWATISPSPYEYSVFSAGPRGCPGYAFGVSVVKVAVAMIMSRYRVALVPNTQIDYKVKVTLSPRRPVPAVLRRQDGAFVAAPIRGAIRNLVQFPN